jgi:ribosomal protein S18 acetylase RimI-like enzyme
MTNGRETRALVMSRRSVRLSETTDSEYAEFTSQHIVEYAHQLERAGEVPVGHGLATSQSRLLDLSADRLRAADHVFFVARSAYDASRVGWVWLSPAPTFLGPGHDGSGWLSQLTIHEALRDSGWGRATLVATEHHLASAGVDQLWLRVFTWNAVARRLYESLGYEPVRQFPRDAHLRKKLSRVPDGWAHQ